MRWTRALDKLPAEDQEVLVRFGTNVSLAIFDRTARIFRLRDGTGRDPFREELYWAGLQSPVKK